MAIKGLFASHMGLVGETANDLSGRVLRLGVGGTAPLLALSAGMPKEKINTTSFSWIEDDHISGRQATTAAALINATTIVVDDAGIWVPNSVIFDTRTGEYMLITGIASDNVTVTVVRGICGTAPAAVNNADVMQLVGTAHAEGSSKPDAVTQQGDEYSNYVQIFKNAWSITGTAKAVGYITGSKLTRNKEHCFNYHAEDIERTSFWGKKGSMSLSGKRLNLTNGLISQIESYGGLVVSANSGGVAGNLNLEDFEDFMRQIFDVQAKGMVNERMAFSGSKFLQVLANMVRKDSGYDLKQGVTKYGIAITQIVGFMGTLNIVSHPLMTESPDWGSELYVVHPGMITKKELRETKIREFTSEANTNAGEDADSGYILDELGFEIRGARTMGIYRNIQVGVAS